MARTIAGALLAMAVMLAGCATSEPVDPGLIPLATSRAGMFDSACPAALLEGMLIAHPATGSAIAGDPRPIPIIWPFGFRGRRTGVVLEILDRSGAIVARSGESIRLSGGEITGDGQWSTCGPPLGPG